MSYWIRMNFHTIEKENLLYFCNNVMEDCRKFAEEIIKDSIYSIPSINHDIDILLEESDYKKTWKYTDREWLYHLFSVRFIYWEPYNLLGVVGKLSKEMEKSFKTIEFQNSADQDYDYSEWKGIDYFETIVNEFNHADINMLSNQNTDWSVEDIKSDIEYCRRSLIYEKIYRTLELNEYIYEEIGNFMRFSMQAITGSDFHFKLCTILEVIRKEHISDLE